MSSMEKVGVLPGCSSSGRRWRSSTTRANAPSSLWLRTGRSWGGSALSHWQASPRSGCFGSSDAGYGVRPSLGGRGGALPGRSPRLRPRSARSVTRLPGRWRGRLGVLVIGRAECSRSSPVTEVHLGRRFQAGSLVWRSEWHCWRWRCGWLSTLFKFLSPPWSRCLACCSSTP